LTLPKPTPTGAWRSLIRVSWPRRSTITGRLSKSSLGLPKSTSSGVLRSLTEAGWPRRASTTGRPCRSSLTTPQPSPTCSMFSGGSARARRTRRRAEREWNNAAHMSENRLGTFGRPAFSLGVHNTAHLEDWACAWRKTLAPVRVGPHRTMASGSTILTPRWKLGVLTSGVSHLAWELVFHEYSMAHERGEHEQGQISWPGT